MVPVSGALNVVTYSTICNSYTTRGKYEPSKNFSMFV